MHSSPIVAILAWGQYIHWAHLQYERYVCAEDNVSESHQIGAVAHWLASEYVVLEGWRDLRLSSKRVSRLIDLYPEHCETLRRCRNAVYHFQKNILDERIIKCLKNDDEELSWAVALHEEFQRYLVAYPYSRSGTFDEQAGLADELAGCIGWFPEHTLLGSQYRIARKCLKFERMIQDDMSAHGDEERNLVTSTMTNLVNLNSDNHLTMLKRW